MKTNIQPVYSCDHCNKQSTSNSAIILHEKKCKRNPAYVPRSYSMHTNWYSPNTYGSNYGEPPSSSGVYCIKEYSHLEKSSRVVYVGSSKDLLARYKGHPVLKKLRKSSDYHSYLFYWRNTPYGWYDLEIALIKRLKPKHNKQHNQ
jgi:hypothetical protein